VFVDRREQQSEHTALLYAVEQRIQNATPDADTVSHHFDYPVLDTAGTVTLAAAPPYLDYDAPHAGEAAAIAEVLADEWAKSDHERSIRTWAYRDGLAPRMDELAARIAVDVDRTRVQVKERLLAEINHWDREHNRLEALERAGTIGRIRADVALQRARQLDERLDKRLRALDESTELVALPAVVRGSALVVPSQRLSIGDEDAAAPQTFARNTELVERRAVEAVLATERALGRTPHEMPTNNPGYDIQSFDAEGRIHYIEVKGRIEGSDTFTITTNEVTFAQTQGDRHRLALVLVSPDGEKRDQLRYVLDAFAHIEPSATTRSYNEEWRNYWDRGGPAQ